MRINKQAAFNEAVRGLNAQRAFSIKEGHPGSCRYRGSNGTKCAIGFLIPDKEYSPDLEDMNGGTKEVCMAVSVEFANGVYEFGDGGFLHSMQRAIHDNLSDPLSGQWDQAKFEEAVADFAETHNLTNPLTGE